MLKKNDIIRHCSGNFLIEKLPSNFHKFSEKRLIKFLEENQWDAMDGRSPNEVMNIIEDAAETMILFLRSHGVEIQE